MLPAISPGAADTADDENKITGHTAEEIILYICFKITHLFKNVYEISFYTFRLYCRQLIFVNSISPNVNKRA